jgi:DNA-binding SARP family transcriptional activator
MNDISAGQVPESADPKVRLTLLGGFELRSVHSGDRAVSMPPDSQRLLAVVALRKFPVGRENAADLLWPRGPRWRAAARLRAAARAARTTGGPLLAAGPGLALAAGVVVDHREVVAQVIRTVGAGRATSSMPATVIAQLGQELLAGWSDDWLDADRDRWDRFRRRALIRLVPDASSRRPVATGVAEPTRRAA